MVAPVGPSSTADVEYRGTGSRCGIRSPYRLACTATDRCTAGRREGKQVATNESVGFLFGGVPYLKVGGARRLVMVQGLTPEHDVPRGLDAWIARSTAKPFAEHFTVYAVNRRRGLAPGESMSQIAGHLAAAIEHDIGGPVHLQGTSTGGSVALQLAFDRPDLVRRLVLTCAACRLGERGRALQADLARAIRAGRGREGSTRMIAAMLPLGGSLLRPLAWLIGGSMVPEKPSDMLVTLDAEDAFDLEADLARVTAPTLVVGGTKDVFYGPESADLFRRTAAGVREGRMHLFEGWGHMRTSSAGAASRVALEFLLEDAAG